MNLRDIPVKTEPTTKPLDQRIEDLRSQIEGDIRLDLLRLENLELKQNWKNFSENWSNFMEENRESMIVHHGEMMHEISVIEADLNRKIATLSQSNNQLSQLIDSKIKSFAATVAGNAEKAAEKAMEKAEKISDKAIDSLQHREDVACQKIISLCNNHKWIITALILSPSFAIFDIIGRLLGWF